MPSTRLLAVKTLEIWSEGEFFAQEIIDQQALSHRLDSRDTALLYNIVVTTLRNLRLLDAWISKVVQQKKLEPRIQWLLRTSLAQLMILEKPGHAVVNESVNLAGRAKGLVNAVLRRTTREKAEWLAWLEKLPLDVRYSQPKWLVKRWEKQFGSEILLPWLRWNQTPAEIYFRVNTLHPEAPSADELKECTQHTHPRFYQTNKVPRTWLEEGKVYVQDPSTAVACDLLEPRLGDYVLDACAAPGGKTSYLAQLMQNTGKIVACDSQPRRLNKLQANLERLKVTNTQIIHQDWERDLDPNLLDLKFDKILLDVPCSNSGVIRRRVDVRWRLTQDDFTQLSELQRQIVRATVPLLKPGGEIVFSSCSLDELENQAAIAQIQSDFPQLKLVEQKRVLPWVDKVDGAFAAKYKF